MPAWLVARAASLTAVIVAAIHIATLHDHFKHQPYIGALFLGLVAGMAWMTLALWQHHDDALAWWGGALLAALAAVGFVFSRTFGLPSFNPAGEWNPIGIASLIAEGGLVGLLAVRLALVPSAGRLSWHTPAQR